MKRFVLLSRGKRCQGQSHTLSTDSENVFRREARGDGHCGMETSQYLLTEGRGRIGVFFVRAGRGDHLMGNKRNTEIQNGYVSNLKPSVSSLKYSNKFDARDSRPQCLKFLRAKIKQLLTGKLRRSLSGTFYDKYF